MHGPYIDSLIEKARRIHGRVAVPDAQFDERAMRACCEVQQNGWLDVIFTGSRRAHTEFADKLGLDISGIEIIDPEETAEFAAMCDHYSERRAKDNLTPAQIAELLHEPSYFACMLVKWGKVDAICSGVHYSTADLARAVLKIIGLKPGVRKMSACAVMYFPHSPMGDNLVFAAADTAVLPVPTMEELAEIAILAADKAAPILPEAPRVAMISFSTHGSASHELVSKVTGALEIVKTQRPDILIDGEFQLDSAISPSVAAKKIKQPSEVAGRANVLIWPDLQSGNIGLKAMQLMGGGMLIGEPFLGVDCLISDHSRGATVDEMVVHIAFVGAQVTRS